MDARIAIIQSQIIQLQAAIRHSEAEEISSKISDIQSKLLKASSSRKKLPPQRYQFNYPIPKSPA